MLHHVPPLVLASGSSRGLHGSIVDRHAMFDGATWIVLLALFINALGQDVLLVMQNTTGTVLKSFPGHAEHL